MNILVVGGTVFLSRTMVEVALAHGHTVTNLNRGLTGEPVPGAEQLRGDRTNSADLQQLAGREFDLVFDTGYFPQPVRETAEILAATTEHYCYVSSINAFPGWPEQVDYQAGGEYDGDPDAVGEQTPPDLPEAGYYGWRKVSGERAVLRAFGPDRTSILRCGLIIGAHDAIGRLPWWIDRIHRGGVTLAPGAPTDQLRLIDARDVAEFALLRAAGTFELSGPAGQLTRGELFDIIAEVTGADVDFRWVPDDKLTGVEGWTELPLWLPAAEIPGAWAHDTTPAERAGLTCRAVATSVADTWAWMQAIPGGWQPIAQTPGLSPAKEAELLAR